MLCSFYIKMIQQTSLMAYDEIRPSLQKREMEVLEVIKKARFGITNNEISKFLNLPINCITGRTNSLVKKKKVKNSGKRLCFYTKKMCIIWQEK
jgi:DNA-binding NarL/FixJ family response regulator